MKTIYQLLVLIRERVLYEVSESGGMSSSGLCHIIMRFELYDIITIEESALVKKYLFENRPIHSRMSAWFWKTYMAKPRLKWLDKHIELNK